MLFRSLASVWGLAALVLMRGADTYHQLVLQILLAGISAGGAFGLSTIPMAAILYSWTIIAASAAAMLMSGDADSTGEQMVVCVLWATYGIYLARNVVIHAARFHENTRNRVELTEKGQVIGLLLNDFQEHGSDWLWETDAEGLILEPSRRFAEVTGRSVEELNGLALRALLAGGEAEGTEDLLDAMAWYDTFRDRVVTIEVGGQRRRWSLTGRPIFRPNGTFCGYHGVGSDVTEAKAAEERITYLAQTDAEIGRAHV